MAYTSHRHHSQQKVSAHRVKHLLASGGCTPKKAKGGGVGTGGGMGEKNAEKALNRMHGKKELHEAFRRGGPARGNDSAEQMADMRPTSAEESSVYTEGVRASKRIPKKAGGAIGRPLHVNIDASKHLHVHAGHPMMGGPIGPQGAAGAMAQPGPQMAGPAPGLPQGLPTAPPAGMPMRAAGGHVRAGSFSGVGRLNQFHEFGHDD
jgi:hypothetical protein